MSQNTVFSGMSSNAAEARWQTYCGFLDLSPGEFMAIQHRRLGEQMGLLQQSPLAGAVLPSKLPTDADGIRHALPITRESDYAAWLRQGAEAMLPAPTAFWAYTSMPGGGAKWVPFTHAAFGHLVDLAIATALLSTAREKGDVAVWPGARVLYSLAPTPYLCGYLPAAMIAREGWRVMPPPDLPGNMPFEGLLQAGFQMALREGVDLIYGMASVLVRMANRLQEGAPHSGLSLRWLRLPGAYRVARAVLSSRLEGRPLLPRDLWRAKGIVAWGTDTGLYGPRIAQAWGQEPHQFLATTETGILALQGWGGRPGMLFSPLSAFLEFIPAGEWRRLGEDPSYMPESVLLDRVAEGQVYHPVVTSFHGMPFTRYELGYMVRAMGPEGGDPEAALPRFEVLDRADGVIDLAGFTRLDRATVEEALMAVGAWPRPWRAHKEHAQGSVHLYLELEARSGDDPAALRGAIHRALQAIDPSYRSLVDLLGEDPLHLSLAESLGPGEPGGLHGGPGWGGASSRHGARLGQAG